MSTLYETCFNQLLSGDATASQLEELSPQMLVQMLQSLAQRTKDAEETRDTANRELSELRKNRFIVDPPYLSDRVGDDMYERVQLVTAKWDARSADTASWTAHHSASNYCDKQVVWDGATSAFKFKSFRESYEPGYKRMDHVISSPMLLYRVLCLFPAAAGVDVDHDRYKVLWACEVRHIATGEAMGFSEWKGAAMFRVSNLQAPKQFEDDMLELLNLLCDPRCPHTYDGTVAGTVA